LQPEESRSGEFGIKSQHGASYWSASVYKTKIENLITWQQFFGPLPGDSVWRPVNVNDATIEGLDLTAGTAINDWRLAAHASLLNPTDDNTGKRLLRRSKQLAGLDVDRDLGDKLSLGASWNIQGGRTDSGNNYDQGFSTVDLRASYLPMKDLKISLSVNNLFDTDYTVAYGYETQRTNAMLTAAYSF
jgi:vitamin B12 transporter